MTRSCVLIVILGILASGTRGDDDTTNKTSVSEPVNATSSQLPVALLILNIPPKELQGNGTTSQRNDSELAEPQRILVVTLGIPGGNGTEDFPESTPDVEQPVKRSARLPHSRSRRSVNAGDDTPLIRKKRTFSKHKGCMLCGMIPQIIVMKQPVYHQPRHQPHPQPCHQCQQQPVYRPPPPPPPQPYCDPCQQKQQHYQPPPQQYSPCGGGGCGGGHPGGNSWSHSSSSSSSQSSSGSYWKKK